MSDSALPPPLPPTSDSSAPATAGCGSYALGIASFVPLIGVGFGIAAVVLGFMRRAWLVVGLGIAGILCSVFIYGSLFYKLFQAEKDGTFDRMRHELAIKNLNESVREIEAFKLREGRYPAALSEVHPNDLLKQTIFIDPTAFQRAGENSPYLYYEPEPSGAGYFLRSVGPDKVPFTADDVLPSLSEDERRKTGLKLAR